jgi:hypothetical protein
MTADLADEQGASLQLAVQGEMNPYLRLQKNVILAWTLTKII